MVVNYDRANNKQTQKAVNLTSWKDAVLPLQPKKKLLAIHLFSKQSEIRIFFTKQQTLQKNHGEHLQCQSTT